MNTINTGRSWQMIAGLVFIAFLSCKGKEDKRPDSPPIISSPDTAAGDHPVINTGDTSYTVIPFDEKHGWLFRGAKATNLSAEEIEVITGLLKEAIQEHNKSAKDFDQVRSLESYFKQLVPVINQRGEKEVWVNCFCAGDSFANWRKQIVEVDDGGNCFFNLKINLSEKKSYDLMVNGMA